MKSHLNRLAGLVERRPLLVALGVTALAGATALFPISGAEAAPVSKPTFVLVHGAFAESSSWDRTAAALLQKGYPVVAVANPLRGLTSDAAYMADLIQSIEGPIVMVGPSYGGAVISNVATGRAHVKALAFVAGFAPDEGESAAALSGQFPGSTPGQALLPPVALKDGSKDLYIRQDRFRAQFAADVPAAQATR